MSKWCCLQHKILVLEGTMDMDPDFFDQIVTNEKQIKIYLERGRPQCKKYFKLYESDDGFDVSQVLDLIIQTYHKSVKEIFNNDRDAILASDLFGFKYDEKTNSVYPIVNH